MTTLSKLTCVSFLPGNCPRKLGRFRSRTAMRPSPCGSVQNASLQVAKCFLLQTLSSETALPLHDLRTVCGVRAACKAATCVPAAIQIKSVFLTSGVISPGVVPSSIIIPREASTIPKSRAEAIARRSVSQPSTLEGQEEPELLRRFSLSKTRNLPLFTRSGGALCSARFAEGDSGGHHVSGFEAREAPLLQGGSEQVQEQLSGKWQLEKSGCKSQEIRVQSVYAHDAEGRRWWEEVGAILHRDAGTDEWGGLWNKWAGRGMLLAAIPGMAGAGWNLEGPQSVLQALGVLAAIITVHETGHFLAARLQGIIVTKFAVGFGPTLAKFDRNGVEYSLRTFPFGGFVAFPDDDPNTEFDPEDPNLLKNRPIKDRAIVISAGVIANLIFAYSVLLTQTLSVGLLEQEMFPGVMVPEVISKSAASRAGMKAGDVVLGVDGYTFSAKEAAVFELVDTIKQSGGKSLSLSVQRGPEMVNVVVTPDTNLDGSGRIGVQLSPNAKPHRVKAKGLPEAVVVSSREFVRLTGTVVEGLKQIIFNFRKTVDNVSGPVAIVAVGAEVARNDIAGLFQFAAIVNINLAIVNLLPLPALDGGYLAFVALEAIRGGKKLPEGVEQGIMSSGVLLLLMLGVVLMVRDTLNLGFVQQML